MIHATTSSQGPGVELARSLLFVPGDRSDRFTKAAASEADVVECDLEDSVAPAAKGPARDNVAAWLTHGGVAAVRVNSVDSPWHEPDCSALRGLNGLLAVIVPKSEDPEALSTLHQQLGGHVPVIALVETALGLHRAYQLAAAAGVVRLAFGAVDFALDTGAGEDDLALLYARSALVVASRAAGNAQPIDGVTLALDDPLLAGANATSARRLGFAGKLCIHPSQVPVGNAAFTPTSQAVDRARHIVQATADGTAARVEGQMVDAPVLERAKQVLRQANRWSMFPQKRS